MFLIYIQYSNDVTNINFRSQLNYKLINCYLYTNISNEIILTVLIKSQVVIYKIN